MRKAPNRRVRLAALARDSDVATSHEASVPSTRAKMSLHSVKTFLAEHAPDIPVIELPSSAATVALAAEAHGVEPGRIAKTLSLRVGGVSPFGLSRALRVYCDVSLRDFDEVLPAAGATNAAVRIRPERLAALTGATWVDVTAPPPSAAPSAPPGTLRR